MYTRTTGEKMLPERMDLAQTVDVQTIKSPRQNRSPPLGNHQFRFFLVERTRHIPPDTRNTFLLGPCTQMSTSKFVVWETKRDTDDPSFFPIGSSYSTPTQTPGANLVLPTNLTAPRLWKPGSVDSTWHLEPTRILGSSSVFCGS